MPHILISMLLLRSLVFMMGMEEVDKFHDLEEQLKSRGYSSIWKKIVLKLGLQDGKCRQKAMKTAYGLPGGVCCLCILNMVLLVVTSMELSSFCNADMYVLVFYFTWFCL
ncbi:hypothetical protein REPUB_Repub09cG0084000 [Reevesia pubescens]